MVKALTLRSVNGPQFTIIDGGHTNRCAYLTNSATLTGFTLTNGVSVSGGGGVYGGTVNNCTLSGNYAGDFGWGVGGGGASGCTWNNCALTSNTGNTGNGGGASFSTLNNCTLTRNSGGAVWYCTLNNCICYFNSALNPAPGEANYDSYSALSYCCTRPLPTNGVGNIPLDPQLASSSHVSVVSPCRGAGNPAYANGVDMDGESWANPPSIGCDEYHSGAVTGPLRVDIVVSFTNVPTGFTVQLTALIQGRTTASLWDFGDGITVNNQPYVSHAWTALGDYAVVLRAFNESQPDGTSAAVTVHVVPQLVHFVAADSDRPIPPYASWATAATNIQDAVDIALAGDEIVVTNGMYATGGRATVGDSTINRVAVDKPLSLRSINGPRSTIIDGGNSGRCVYLSSSASLSGFTLTNGTAYYGGGVFCESSNDMVSNCVVSGNSTSETVTNDAPYPAGGGAYGGTLNNCLLIGNTARGCYLGYCNGGFGGGANGCLLNNCMLGGNWAYDGGGAWGCTLNNCTLTVNFARGVGGGAAGCKLNNCILSVNSQGLTGQVTANYFNSTLNFCCSIPQPTNGIGNITNAPLFVDQACGNLRLQPNSPCINAGRNAFAPAGLDLDGNPRIAGGTVDIGAYEFQSSASLISYAWLQQYDLPTDGSADNADPDGDGLNNWQEWRCGTDPTNALSALRLLTPLTGGVTAAVTWQSIAGESYFLERAASLAESPTFAPLASNLPGQPGTTTYTDSNAIGAGPWFYRVGVTTP